MRTGLDRDVIGSKRDRGSLNSLSVKGRRLRPLLTLSGIYPANQPLSVRLQTRIYQLTQRTIKASVFPAKPAIGRRWATSSARVSLMVRSDEAVATQRSPKLCVLDDTYFTQPQGYIGVNRTRGRFFLILRAAPEAARFFSKVTTLPYFLPDTRSVLCSLA